MSFAILGLGTALPAFRFTQEEAVRVAQVLCLDPRQAPLVPVLYRQTEIGGRNLRPTVERTHVGFMGCHGALNGLRVARALTGADPSARVLLCAVELCSLHYHYGWDPKRVVANALFGDGAAAIVGAPVPDAATH